MNWKIDNAHSEISFSIRHMMISNVRGHFENFEGEVNFDAERPENTKVEARIEAASINTREDARDNHLRSPDFLDVENYPYITFKSTKVEIKDETRAKLYGDLTIRDETRPIVLDVEFNGLAKSPWGTTSAGFSATTTLKRKDWGLVWNQTLETGGVLVGEDLKVYIELEIVKQDVAEEVEEAQAEPA